MIDLAWQVGAPPEVATLLEEIGRERCAAAAAGGEVGLDPELDEFMVRQALIITRARTTRFASSNSRCAVITCDRRDGGGAQEAYCGVLEHYKEELSRPLDEAASFLSSIRTQLSTLCGGAASLSGSPPAARLHLPSLPPPAGGQGSKYELPSPLRTWHASVQCIVGGRG